MPLDLVILGPDGRPARTVGIGVSQHAELVAQAKSRGLTLLQRLEEYYEDAQFSADELSALVDELSKVEAAIDQSSELAALLQDIVGLVTFARNEHREVEALAD